MKIVTEREVLRAVAARWEDTYRYTIGKPTDLPYAGKTKGETLAALRMLDPETCTSAEVDAVIGNGSWTCGRCSECGATVRTYVLMAGNDEYGPDAICFDCIAEAYGMVTSSGHVW
jgi:hypothetical protein